MPVLIGELLLSFFVSKPKREAARRSFPSRLCLPSRGDVIGFLSAVNTLLKPVQYFAFYPSDSIAA
jgi:hypothetical protein